jgi:hypothetical protein
MSVENEPKPTAGNVQQSGQDNGAHSPQQSDSNKEQPHPLSAQAQRDLEIEEIQKNSKNQVVGIQKPPDVPPAPPRTALTIVGVLLVALLLAG